MLSSDEIRSQEDTVDVSYENKFGRLCFYGEC